MEWSGVVWPESIAKMTVYCKGEQITKKKNPSPPPPQQMALTTVPQGISIRDYIVFERLYGKNMHWVQGAFGLPEPTHYGSKEPRIET